MVCDTANDINKQLHKQVEILEQPFDAFDKIRAYQADLAIEKTGALSLFVGTMRDFNQDKKVQSMLLEHYPQMTQKYIVAQMVKMYNRYSINNIRIVHRIGTIYPGDTIVVVAVWAAHRRDAIAANHYLVEQLKSKAPFWKKEILADQSTHWVETNTPSAEITV
ncbi:MAG: molybdenum cofactor biosynthesis protein MoaE [Chromatiales bacterium]|nr:molybdenum cofactor biosynthesis protein MoaE [Chromatiales bacterium]